MNSKYNSYFCKSSYHRTLCNLIGSGEYCKTPKRKTAMYCFGSTITCTRYPKFLHNGRPKILPRPYQSCKPKNSGYSIIRSTWMQALLQDIETQTFYYLQKICSRSKDIIKTLLYMSLSKSMIPECLRLGETCFTHMTVFGTVGKEDGNMPIHFDERDIISCVFHLGDVHSGGDTEYYDGNSSKKVGDCIYTVPFRHGTLQIGLFRNILHGVQYWEGQRCGIQVNIKKDVLKHFITYGNEYYNKFRATDYPQGPIIYY